MSQNLDIGARQSGSGLDIGALQSATSGALTVTLSGPVPSRYSIPSPSIANAGDLITLAGPVPSLYAIFAPVISHDEIHPPGPVPSRYAVPAPLLITIILAPGVVPSRYSIPSPSVLRAEQFINLSSRPGIPSRYSMGIPAMLGGAADLRFFIGGVDLTTIGDSGAAPAGTGTNAIASTLVSQAIGRQTLTIDYEDTGGNLVPGLFTAAQDLCGVTVQVVEQGLTLFAGCIDTVGVDREMPFTGSTVITYHITALDKTSICDHRVDTGMVFPVGSDPSEDVLAIVANFLNGEGITTQGVPIAGTFGPLSAATSGQYQTVRQALDEIATAAGAVWWIDAYGVLWFQSVTTLPAAPWNLDETDPNAPFRNSLGTPMVQNSVSGGSQTSGYRNKEYVVSNLNTIPGAAPNSGGGSSTGGVTETISFSEGEPGVWDDPPGTPYGILTSLPIGSIQSLTVNGNAQTVYELSNFNGQTSTGPNDFLWAYLAGDTQVGPDFGPIPPGATIIITYVPGGGPSNSASVVVGSASNPLTPTGPTFGHCGSGLFEVIDQVVNVSLISDLNALAQQFLNKSGAIPQIVTYETDKPGIFVGMGQTVYLPSLGIPRTGTTPLTFVVSQISGTAQTGPLGFGSWYRWTITLINNYDPANWIAYYSALIAGTENPLPVLTQQPYRWALGNGSSLAAGNSVTNPTQVLQTGLVTAFAIAAANPPVNQTLVVTILRNNIQIAQLVLTPSATPNVFITTQVPASNGLYLYLGDVLSLNVSYVAGTGTPVKAMNVTVCVYTSM